eukprot:COSAG06_NODE_46098_length_349_cov_1.032000_1_plen_61_part_10
MPQHDLQQPLREDEATPPTCSGNRSNLAFGLLGTLAVGAQLGLMVSVASSESKQAAALAPQ